MREAFLLLLDMFMNQSLPCLMSYESNFVGLSFSFGNREVGAWVREDIISKGNQTHIFYWVQAEFVLLNFPDPWIFFCLTSIYIIWVFVFSQEVYYENNTWFMSRILLFFFVIFLQASFIMNPFFGLILMVEWIPRGDN